MREGGGVSASSRRLFPNSCRKGILVWAQLQEVGGCSESAGGWGRGAFLVASSVPVIPEARAPSLEGCGGGAGGLRSKRVAGSLLEGPLGGLVG